MDNEGQLKCVDEGRRETENNANNRVKEENSTNISGHCPNSQSHSPVSPNYSSATSYNPSSSIENVATSVTEELNLQDIQVNRPISPSYSPATPTYSPTSPLYRPTSPKFFQISSNDNVPCNALKYNLNSQDIPGHDTNSLPYSPASPTYEYDPTSPSYRPTSSKSSSENVATDAVKKELNSQGIAGNSFNSPLYSPASPAYSPTSQSYLSSSPTNCSTSSIENVSKDSPSSPVIRIINLPKLTTASGIVKMVKKHVELKSTIKNVYARKDKSTAITYAYMVFNLCDDAKATLDALNGYSSENNQRLKIDLIHPNMEYATLSKKRVCGDATHELGHLVKKLWESSTRPANVWDLKSNPISVWDRKYFKNENNVGLSYQGLMRSSLNENITLACSTTSNRARHRMESTHNSHNRSRSIRYIDRDRPSFDAHRNPVQNLNKNNTMVPSSSSSRKRCRVDSGHYTNKRPRSIRYNDRERPWSDAHKNHRGEKLSKNNHNYFEIVKRPNGSVREIWIQRK